MAQGSTTQPTTVTGYPTAAVLTDNFAAPTVTQIGTVSLAFNGSNYDRVRNNVSTTTGDSGTKTVTFNGFTQINHNNRGMYTTVLLGTVSGTSPTLAVQLQYSFDAGATWLNIGAVATSLTLTGQTLSYFVYPTNISVAGATPAALTTGATQTIALNSPLPRVWRFTYTIGGTSPSFGITGVYVNYMA